MTNVDLLFCSRCGHRRDRHVHTDGSGVGLAPCMSKETKAVARGKATHCGCPRFASPLAPKVQVRR